MFKLPFFGALLALAASFKGPDAISNSLIQAASEAQSIASLLPGDTGNAPEVWGAFRRRPSQRQVRRQRRRTQLFPA